VGLMPMWEKPHSVGSQHHKGDEKDYDKGYAGEHNDQPKVRVFGVAKMSEGEEAFHGWLDAISPV
jgi:hypothetical protein